MRRFFTALTVAVLTVLLMIGCNKGKVVPVKVVVTNATELEFAKVILQIPPKTGSYSPMHYLLSADDESLKQGEKREFTTHLYEQDFGREGWAIVYIAGDEQEHICGYIRLQNDSNNRFEVTCDSNMVFSIAVVS